MLDTLFWYTGLVVWTFIVFGWAAMLYCTVRDKWSRSVRQQGPQRVNAK